jgi:hypothetical protein
MSGIPRLDKSVFGFSSLRDNDEECVNYWLSKTPEESLSARKRNDR